MVKVYADMGMSLDGYVAGPNAGPQNALGDGGMLLHRWVFDLESWRERQSLPGGRTNRDDEIVEEKNARNGAFVMGRRMFDEGEVGWPDPPPSARRCSSSPTTPGNPGSGREARPSPSSPTASGAPCSKRRPPRATKTSRSRAART